MASPPALMSLRISTPAPGTTIDGGGVESSDGPVQYNAAEHFDPGHFFADQIRHGRRGFEVVLDDDCAESSGFGVSGGINEVDRSRHGVRIAVDVDVDDAAKVLGC